QGLAQPVARLSKQGGVGRTLDRALERFARVLVLAALEARAAALDQLGDDAEDGAERVAREEAWRRRRRQGQGKEVGLHPRSWQRRHRLGRGWQERRRARELGLVEC